MASALLVALAMLAAPPADWPQFRGPSGDGHALAERLPTAWSEASGVVWKTELPGRGWSSPVVTRDRIWLTAAEQTALTQAEREARIKAIPHGDQLQTHAAVTLLALEVDLASGKLLRKIELATIDDPAPIHANNSYATPTPVLAAGRLFCDFGPLGTYAVDIGAGDVLWQQKLAVAYITGAASSPVVWRDRLILTRDGTDEQYLAALDIKTGEEVWRTPRPPLAAKDVTMHRSFSTPLLVAHEGVEQLIVPGAQWLVSYDPESGKERWRVDFGPGYSIVPRPVFAQGHVYFCTGFVAPQLWAVRIDGAGDVSETHVAWKHARQVAETSSPIVVGEELFFVSSKGVATCLDAATGAQRWQQRLGGNYSASPLYADGKLYFLSQEGRTAVLTPGQTYQPLASNQLFGQFLASPIAVDNRLLVRGEAHLYCLGR